MNGTIPALTVHFAPLLPDVWLYGLCALALGLLGLSAWRFRRGLWGRAITAGLFMLLFLNPSIVEEKRTPVDDVVAVITDRSPSQAFGERTERTDQALALLEERLAGLEGLQVRQIAVPHGDEIVNETRLLAALDDAFADVPVSRRAGAIFITDGQIHDIPQNPEMMDDYGPLHALLSGERNERDRQLVVTEAPAYGIVGQDATIRYRIEDTPNIREDYATITLHSNDHAPVSRRVRIGVEQSLTVKIDHAGQNIFDLDVSAAADEITLANNRVPVLVNGVRDRLRVLLVSGLPHAGGRTWRNILTADPAVDLVHFTILREPEKLDATPQNELSLIAFPFRELFEVKLYDFDLIIFDRYQMNRILPHFYFANIARYVREGGALLEVSGPSYAGNDSIYTTALGDILPGYPTGQIFEQAYRPAVTETGQRHPVTRALHRQAQAHESAPWGAWLRQVGVAPTQGHVLMKGANDQPLLILDRVGDGRIAHLASDQIWLWSRGYDGGGPHAELLRRLAHWLMKEPELEEDMLSVRTAGYNIIIERYTLESGDKSALLTKPDGTQETITLRAGTDGTLEGRHRATQHGVYSIDDGQQRRFAVIGSLHAPEMRQVITTSDKFAPLARKTGGTVQWLSDHMIPDIRLVTQGRNYGGRGWIGLRNNNAYTVAGVTDRPFLPPWVYALLLIGAALVAWWMEGRRRKERTHASG